MGAVNDGEFEPMMRLQVLFPCGDTKMFELLDTEAEAIMEVEPGSEIIFECPYHSDQRLIIRGIPVGTMVV